MTLINRAELLALLLERVKTARSRYLVAIAGPPAAGKSTLSQGLLATINSKLGGEAAGLISQDGFHYDDRVLKARDLLDYKGAANTFDVPGLHSLLRRARNNEEIAVPRFDRKLEISRNCAALISENTRLILVEGNYLLLDDAGPWSALKPLFDVTVSLQVALPELQQRLLARWRHYGYSEESALKKTLENDMPNALKVINESAESDYILRSHDSSRVIS